MSQPVATNPPITEHRVAAILQCEHLLDYPWHYCGRTHVQAPVHRVPCDCRARNFGPEPQPVECQGYRIQTPGGGGGWLCVWIGQCDECDRVYWLTR